MKEEEAGSPMMKEVEHSWPHSDIIDVCAGQSQDHASLGMPRWHSIGEYTDESLLSVKDPSKRDEYCLKDLEPSEAPDAALDGVIEGPRRQLGS
ncbi:hypothetical protein GQ457_08G008260 [Hibiscus cannabinus]